jgi:hypothetical protein
MNEADPELDRLLADWAASARMSDDTAERIRQAILAEPAGGLDPSWWRDFSTDIGAVLTRASRAGRVGWSVLPSPV